MTQLFTNRHIKRFARCSLTALGIFALGAVVSIPYGFFEARRFTLEFVFVVNFFIAAIILIAAILLIFFPVFLKRDKLIDHSTIAGRYSEARAKKLKIAHEMLYVGLLYGVFTAVFELVVWVIF